MSRQSKAVKKQALAKKFTAMHKNGEKGPAQTSPQHGKKAERRLYTSKRRGPLDQSAK